MRVHKINKEDLVYVGEIKVGLADTQGMTISHYADSLKGSSATLSFDFDNIDAYVPKINTIEFCNVVRKKVDLSATGVNQNIIKDMGPDIGKYNHANVVPTKPLDAPSGFREIYKK